MLTWEEWREKSNNSLDASRVLLEHQKPVKAASCAYYAAYQMVTGVLIKLKLKPRDEYGNWSHLETLEMYRTHICQKTALDHKEKNALISLRSSFRNLLLKRYVADYGFDKGIDMALSQILWRDASRLVRLLENLIKKGAL
jgi:uncharacterized protein (UPF0332 family)